MNDDHLAGRLVILIIGAIIIIILAYFKSRSEAKKTKGTFVVPKNNIVVNSDPLPSLYFKAIKYPLWGYLLAAVITGLIIMAIHFSLGIGILILLIIVQLFAYKSYLKSLVYIGLTIEEHKIIINKYPPSQDQIIVLEGVHKITFEDIYQKNRKGFDEKVGCEMIFWNIDESIIDTFDVEKFKNSEKLKATILGRIGIS
jgi:hypothetical protein